MKKLNIFILILSLFLVACGSDDTVDRKAKKMKDLKDKKPPIVVEEDLNILVEENLYEDFNQELSVDISAEILEELNINGMLGFPDGNLMKVHSVCFDNTAARAFAVAIMSPTVAVIEDGEVIKYIDINPRDVKSLKYIACGNGNVFVGTPNSIHKIDAVSMELVEEESSKKTLFPNSLKYFPGVDVFMIPNLDDDTQMFYDGETFKLITSLSLGKVHIFETLNDELMFVGFKEQFHDESFIMYYDPVKKEYRGDKFSLDLEGSFEHLTYIAETNEFWAVSNSKRGESVLFVYNLDTKVLDKINLELEDVSRISSGAGKVVILSENGFDEEGRAGFWGGVQVIDIDSKKTDVSKELAWKHNSVGIDEKNMLAYITNNDGGSISVLNLKTGKSDASDSIRLGTAVEGGVATNDSTLIIRNRLAGSTIIQMDINNNLTEIDAGNWPVGVVYDSELDLSFFYDMLDGAVTALKSGSNDLERIFQSDLILGNTDAIGDITYDFTRKIIYVIVPGLNNIVAIDAQDGELIKDIELVDYDQNYAMLSGPAALTAVVYEPTGKLFAYTAFDNYLRVYDSLNDFVLEKEISVDQGKGVKDFSYALYVDNYAGKVYVGEHIYDANTFDYIGKLDYGYNVVDIDYERGFMMTRGIEKNNLEKLYVLDLYGNIYDDLILSEGSDVYSRLAYDKNNGLLYAFYLVEGKLLKIKLF